MIGNREYIILVVVTYIQYSNIFVRMSHVLANVLNFGVYTAAGGSKFLGLLLKLGGPILTGSKQGS